MAIKSVLSRVNVWLMLLFTPLALIFIAPLTTYAQPVDAPVIADDPCDDLYYESLAARAWLEAQREITQNQNIILKPDSVFEYTCFDRLLWELADHADEMLSETDLFGTPLSNTSMDEALEDLVLASLQSYVDTNFGFYPGSLGGHPAGSAVKHTVEGAIDAATPYSCDIMERVWQAAKCINFITEAEFDGFFTFEEYADPAAADKRHLPVACEPITDNWRNNLIVALTSGPWTQDPLQTYIEEITPQECAGNCPCNGEPIPTGLVIIGAGTDTPEEHVCLQPGCRYHPGGQLNNGNAAPGCYGR